MNEYVCSIVYEYIDFNNLCIIFFGVFGYFGYFFRI